MENIVTIKKIRSKRKVLTQQETVKSRILKQKKKSKSFSKLNSNLMEKNEKKDNLSNLTELNLSSYEDSSPSTRKPNYLEKSLFLKGIKALTPKNEYKKRKNLESPICHYYDNSPIIEKVKNERNNFSFFLQKNKEENKENNNKIEEKKEEEEEEDNNILIGFNNDSSDNEENNCNKFKSFVKEVIINNCKQEDNFLKQYEKNQIIKRLHKVKEYQSQKKNEEILEKEKKIEDFKKQKQKVLESKTKMSEQINKEKRELINKFEKAMGRKKQIKPSLVKKLFPNDDKDFKLFFLYVR